MAKTKERRSKQTVFRKEFAFPLTVNGFSVLFVRSAASQNSNEIQRGTYPSMVFIYYPDDSVVDQNGVRVTRAGTLLKPNWLITSSLETDDVPLAFPKKTLIARLGSISIDKNFTINEDEGEQESEVIQIIRPHNFSAIEWWYSDISLLKTLIPFNKTETVGTTSIMAEKLKVAEKECFILVYAMRASNLTQDRILMEIPVDIVSPPSNTCGSRFRESTMICAQDIDEKKNVSYDPNFCVGNGGGPLICEKDIYGLQTYSDGCKEPYLYQLFTLWSSFISCGIQDICNEKQCEAVCTVIHKDSEYRMMLNEVKTETTAMSAKYIESDDSSEEPSPEGPTATTVKQDEAATTVPTVAIPAADSSLDTEVTAESQSTEASTTKSDKDNGRRSNVEAQQQPIKKKSAASPLVPFSMYLPMFAWMLCFV
ncbi:unnamed protein product [Leptosia nina]|uniref:Peptidase S1 domain-containing protein n=1 Tax=Leptosia nina TaxID=320188 RepID=A0AAV1JR03_9NEOP